IRGELEAGQVRYIRTIDLQHAGGGESLKIGLRPVEDRKSAATGGGEVHAVSGTDGEQRRAAADEETVDDVDDAQTEGVVHELRRGGHVDPPTTESDGQVSGNREGPGIEVHRAGAGTAADVESRSRGGNRLGGIERQVE